jgi:hypothetical protein
MTQLKAQELAKMINRDVPFVASYGWLQTFQKRHGICQLKICGEKLSANNSVIPGFIQSFIQQMKDQDFHFISFHIISFHFISFHLFFKNT